MRDPDEVIKDLRALVESRGYIYALGFMMFQEFHIDPEALHKTNIRNAMSMNEASLLLGFLIQRELDMTIPESVDQLMNLKNATYDLLRELQSSYSKAFHERLENEVSAEGARSTSSEFFGRGQMMVEPIFYSGTGVYDFQFIDFLPKKYKYDEKWLNDKRGFRFGEAAALFKFIKSRLERNASRVRLLREQSKLDYREFAKNSYEGEDFESDFAKISSLLELHQFSDLFFGAGMDGLEPGSDEFVKMGWKNFCANLIELFVVDLEELGQLAGGSEFIENFSVLPGADQNRNFDGIGSYNIWKSHPLIRIGERKIFVPLSFTLSEAIYESPFYWMIGDSEYKPQAGKNRGNASEEISFDLFSQIFGKSAHRNVSVHTKKGVTSTDIDILCILGTKAVCVQIKSQKLKEESRKGDETSLLLDFKRAVQDAFGQGKIARNAILENCGRLTNKSGEEIKLSEEIDDVYIVVVTTENYPSLPHQSRILLQRSDGDPTPLVLTVFDLEILVHYLNDAHEFLYYVRQRTLTFDLYLAQEETAFLGYHLLEKLAHDVEANMVLLDTYFSQVIDRNYFPFRVGLDTPAETDPLRNRWENRDFEEICQTLKTARFSKVTDILFHLFDLSFDSRDQFTNVVRSAKAKTLRDRKLHSVALPPTSRNPRRFGITYVSSEQNSERELQTKTMGLSMMRKYRSKSNAWLGLGSYANSSKIFDVLFYDDSGWKFDEKLEEHSAHLSNSKMRLTTGQKVGRNDPCPCRSGSKFKKCCGSPGFSNGA